MQQALYGMNFLVGGGRHLARGENPAQWRFIHTGLWQVPFPASDNYLPIPAAADLTDKPLAGKRFVITGTLSIKRDATKDLIESKGGKVSGSISAKAHYLFCGDGGGSKRDKAEQLKVPIIDEAALQAMIA